MYPYHLKLKRTAKPSNSIRSTTQNYNLQEEYFCCTALNAQNIQHTTDGRPLSRSSPLLLSKPNCPQHGATFDTAITVKRNKMRAKLPLKSPHDTGEVCTAFGPERYWDNCLTGSDRGLNPAHWHNRGSVFWVHPVRTIPSG